MQMPVAFADAVNPRPVGLTTALPTILTLPSEDVKETDGSP